MRVGITLQFYHVLESNYGPEYEYNSFFATEYEYIYPLGEVKLSPIHV